jgi:TPR repeat protein
MAGFDCLLRMGSGVDRNLSRSGYFLRKSVEIGNYIGHMWLGLAHKQGK